VAYKADGQPEWVAAKTLCVRRSDSGADRRNEGAIVAVEMRSAVRGLWEWTREVM